MFEVSGTILSAGADGVSDKPREELPPSGSVDGQAWSGRFSFGDRGLAGPHVDIGLDGVTGPLQWEDMPLANGGCARGTAGTDRIDGRFHGSGHEDAWGVFDTGAYVEAFGAKHAHVATGGSVASGRGSICGRISAPLDCVDSGAGARSLEPGTWWPTCRRRATKSRRAQGSDIDNKCVSVTAVASQRPSFR